MQSLRNKIINILSTKSTYDIFAMQKLNGLLNDYIPWTSSSIRPSAIVKVINDILINKRKNIIEFGSGVSTLYIAKILNKNGGHLYSVEHDENWITIIKQMLKKENIDETVTFIHAPMRKSTLSLNNLDWYNEDNLNNVLCNCNKFDLILIDGPLAYNKDHMLSRYPAIPFLINIDKIAKESTIILDDIERDGEQIIIKKWEKIYNYNFVKSYVDGGIAISQNGNFYNI